MDAAEVGVGHWSEHVQAQTDANAGRISAHKMDAIFKRTRLAGGADVQRYQRAVVAADKASAPCRAPAGASTSVKSALQNCAVRSRAQQLVLSTAANGMRDWQSHLADMRRSRMGHVHNAQAVWIRTWRAAPPHIKAYETARDRFKAPRC